MYLFPRMLVGCFFEHEQFTWRTIRMKKVRVSNPAVSVVLPTYNDEAYIADAIESILRQSFENFEFLIIDDGSTDQTARIVRRYAKTDGRIQVISQPNSGIVSALNYGISLARGHYIARMDGDDISDHRRFELQLAYLESHPSVVALGTAYTFIDERSDAIEARPVPQTVLRTKLYGPDPSSAWLCHPSTMMRTSTLRAVGGYRYYRHAEDADLWIRLEEYGELRNLTENLFQWRRHSRRVSVENLLEQRKWHALALIFARRRKEGVESPELRSPLALSDVLVELTEYEKCRFGVILAFFLYEYEFYNGCRYEGFKQVYRFLDSNVGNAAAGGSFEPNARDPEWAYSYAIARLKKNRKKLMLMPGMTAFQKLRLVALIVFKDDKLKKMRRASDRDLARIRLARSTELTARYSVEPSSVSTHGDLVEAYESKNFWGTQPVNGAKMLQQTCHILSSKDVIYVECSKNACTTIKRALSLCDHMAHGYLHTAKVHNKKKTPFLGVEDLPREAFIRVLNDPRTFKFCVCRNPYERLASAYLDKIDSLWLLEPNSFAEYFEVSRSIVEIVRGISDCEPDFLKACPIAFTEFVDYINRVGTHRHDRHWLAQNITMRPDLIQYSKVVRFEELNRGMAEICDELELTESVREAFARKANQSRQSISWKQLYDESLAEKVYDLYHDDFVYYGYECDSWKELP